MKPRKSYITLIKIFIKVGFGLFLGLLVEIVYSDRARINPSLRLLGLCNFLVGGIFLIFAGLRLFFGPAYIEVITDGESGELFSSLETEFLCGFGKSGEDILAGLIIFVISIGLMIT
ncbi:MAG: hypothetical protein JSW11_15195 [Candidatus Heimdallarchaeota archaeon]|nr:MAG: hypothetical protein JSW11_15195 [Candidatus Heimdallarchaeota archaeon]